MKFVECKDLVKSQEKVLPLSRSKFEGGPLPSQSPVPPALQSVLTAHKSQAQRAVGTAKPHRASKDKNKKPITLHNRIDSLLTLNETTPNFCIKQATTY